ncbi:MAG: 2-oxoacid:acceptor oxidoreductase family protein, partial [Proteobacteria bacterium]|nr:2-oxoacid:acceptor oxidoreductase family protein [Pseudomonadota bacterium]
PQIRGGEAGALMRLAHTPVDCLGDRFDILIAADWLNIHRFADEIPMDASGVMIGDPEQGEPPEIFLKRGARPGAVPIKHLVKPIPGSWANMIALGLAAGLAGLPMESVKAVLQKSLKKGGGEKMAANLAAAEAGYAAASGMPPVQRLAAQPKSKSATSPDKRWLITGNQAAGLGAAQPTRSRRRPKCWNGSLRRCPRWAAPWCRPKTNSRR